MFAVSAGRRPKIAGGVGSGESSGVSGRLGVSVSAGVGGAGGGHPLQVREQIAHVGERQLAPRSRTARRQCGTQRSRRGMRTHRAHSMSWFCLVVGKVRRHEAHLPAFGSFAGRAVIFAGSTGLNDKGEWASLRLLSVCIGRPDTESETPMVMCVRERRRSKRTRSRAAE